MTRYCWRCAEPLPDRPPVVCAACGQAHFHNPKPAAMGVVERGGAILLVRRAGDPWRGCWDVPGGFCDSGEHPVQTAEREVLEESGWRVRAVALIGLWVDTYGSPADDGLQETTLNIAYLARPVDDRPVQGADAETSEMRWFPATDLPQDLAFPGHVPAVLRATRDLLDRHDAGNGYPLGLPGAPPGFRRFPC